MCMCKPLYVYQTYSLLVPSDLCRAKGNSNWWNTALKTPNKTFNKITALFCVLIEHIFATHVIAV